MKQTKCMPGRDGSVTPPCSLCTTFLCLGVIGFFFCFFLIVFLGICFCYWCCFFVYVLWLDYFLIGLVV